MGIATLVIGLGFLIIVGIVAFAMFGDAFKQFQEQIDENLEKQKDTGDVDPEKVGNTAPTTCDLEVRFVGAVTKHNIYNVLDVFADDLFLWIGQHDWAKFVGFPDFPEDKIIYQWHCESSDFLANLSWQIEKLSLASIYDSSDGESIRIKFEGRSLDGSGVMTGVPTNSKTGERLTVFQNTQTLPFKEDFPLALDLKVVIDDVPHDNYRILFWSDKDFMGVDGPIKEKGHKYSAIICGVELKDDGSLEGLVWNGQQCVAQ